MATANRRAKKRISEQTAYFFDFSLLFIVLFLLGFGMIMIYSASSYEAFEAHGDAAYYLKKQAVAVALGLFAMTISAFFPMKIWEKYSTWIYVVSLVLVVLVKTPLGISANGATRWVRIPGIGMQIQPAEVVKLAIIVITGALICSLGKSIRTLKGTIITVAPAALAIGMIFIITNNLSSAIIVAAIVAVMLFVAHPKTEWFVIGGVIVLALAVLLVILAINVEGFGFRFARIRIWLNPESDSQNLGFQTLQGLYAIGSGGIWGKGLGNSMQKLNFLPEAQNDMIFSILCEELGLFGAIAIIILFAMLIWRMMVIANNCTDLFDAMVVTGVMSHIAIQALLNIAVVTNTIPNTGISLPFISYGGSSVVFLLTEIGLVLNVSRRIRLKE